MKFKHYLATLALLGVTTLPLHLQAETEKKQVLAHGYGKLSYTAPAIGSYELPSLGDAADGEVLTSLGKSNTLHELTGDKAVLMSFIYTSCSDVNGCPLASYVMARVQNRILKDPELSKSVRLLSLSFDPEYDTPEQLARYSKNFKKPQADWRFLTTESEDKLQKILNAYGQYRQKNYDENGDYEGSMSHILRVFLIDKDRKIRNIYSTGFLHPDTVFNDISTVLLPSKNGVASTGP